MVESIMNPRILLIEDDAGLQVRLYEILSQAGYDVAVAMADDYLFMAQEVKPDILVLGCDQDRTFERGWNIARTLRRQQPHLIMVLLSTNNAVVDEVGHSVRGMMFYVGIRKPLAVDDLLRTLYGLRC